MPSWGIHLAAATEAVRCLCVEENAFLFGNILPDILCGYVVEDVSCVLDYFETHRSFVSSPNVMPSFPNCKLFLEDFNDCMNDDTAIGYYFHLLTDFTWNTYAAKRLHGLSPEDYSRGEQLTLNRMKQLDFSLFDYRLTERMDIHFPRYERSLYESAVRLLPVTVEDCRKGAAVAERIAHGEIPPQSSEYYIFTQQELNELYDSSTEKLIASDEFLSGIMR